MFPIAPGPGPGRDLSAEETAAAFVGFVVFPFVAGCAWWTFVASLCVVVLASFRLPF